MKKGRAFLAALLLLLAAAGLTGCEKYTSHYFAAAFVHSNVSDAAEMSFWQFEGTMVFKLRCKAGEKLHCTGTVKSGEINVFYDCGESKDLLCSLENGSEIDHTLPLTVAGTVYVIVEAQEKCENGQLSFSVEV